MIQENDVKIYTGISLRIKLLSGVGPHKAWEIAKLAHQSIKKSNKPDTARRKLLQRTGLVVGGLAVTLGLENVISSQAHAASITNGPGTSTLLHASDPAVTELKQLPDVLASTKQFGEIDWNTTLQLSGNGQTGYMLFFKPATGTTSNETTYLIIDKGVTGQKVRSIVGRTLVEGQHKIEDQWYTTAGHNIGAIKFANNGEVTGVVNHATANLVTPELNIGCLINCLRINHAVNCSGVCQICVPGIPPTCLACIVCGGISAVSCVRQCW